ncbi:uncharacterized protein LJ206_003113 isoform 1-T1 [Theristicus caerulescens]
MVAELNLCVSWKLLLLRGEPPRHGCDGCLKQETDTLLVSFISLITGNLSLNEGGGRLLQRTGNGLSLKKDGLFILPGSGYKSRMTESLVAPLTSPTLGSPSHMPPACRRLV